jgi:hypothetical protein
MRILREKRLNQELINGVTLNELRSKLYDDMYILQDNDRLLQAISVNKDIKIVEEWIELDKNI